MLKFLTHKLKTQSLNEEQPYQYKADDDHDSGTESDDEHGDTEDQESNMESEADCSSHADRSTNSTSPDTPSVVACPGTVVPGSNSASPLEPYFIDSALPSDSDHNYDHHSSEEELEVINSHPKELAVCRDSYPEKRKWSQVNRLAVESSGSSDEEVQGLLAAMNTPVEFRTSPPLDAHKPGRSQSPPPKVFHYSTARSVRGGSPQGHPLDVNSTVSPRKKHRHTPRAHHIQRPCLDFEKMQQLKARAVTAWRHSGDPGGELSVFCW